MDPPFSSVVMDSFLLLTCGMVLGHLAPEELRAIHRFTQTQSHLLALITFMIFGAILAVPALQQLDLSICAYALLSLTLIRAVAIFISCGSLKLRWDTLFYLSIAGPRGIASLLFGMLVLETLAVPHREVIFSTAIITIFFSIFLHGLSAYPLANWYSAKALDRRRPHDPEGI